MRKIFVDLIHKVRNSLLWIWKQDGSPAERARGVAVGVFSGCFPFFGFQSLIGVFLAKLCKGNPLLAVAATWISNPLTYLPLYWFNYQVGIIFLGGERKLLDFRHLTQQQMWSQSWLISSRILLGSFLVGCLSSLVFGYFSYTIFKFIKRKNTR